MHICYRPKHICSSFSPPARWGLLDFMSVASSSCLVLLSSSSPPPPRRPPRPPRPPPAPLRSMSVCPAGPQPRPSTHSVPCRTSTTTIHAQCSLPDLNHDHPRPVFPAGPQPRPSVPVFPAGPQPRPSPPSVPCRTSCGKIWDKECAEES